MDRMAFMIVSFALQAGGRIATRFALAVRLIRLV
jgi:hypothetical protein